MLQRYVQLALLLTAACFAQANAIAAELTLFSGQNFQGRELRLHGAVGDLSPSDFNDRASSMIVVSGRWEVCLHAGYRDCAIAEPGEYADLGRLGKQLSSLRVVGAGEPGGLGREDGGQPRAGHVGGPGGGAQGRVVLFDGLDLRGASMPLHGDIVNLGELGFNDRARSMVIEAGTWQFCEHANFAGRCRMYGPGQYRNVDRILYRAVSSARVVPDERERRLDRGREGVDLFKATDFRGERVRVRVSTENLEQLSFNDQAGSVIVYRGRWEFCQHADFGGQCLTYGPGRYDRLGSLSHQISSLRRVR